MNKEKEKAAVERPAGDVPAVKKIPRIPVLGRVIERLEGCAGGGRGDSGHEGYFGLLHAQNMQEMLGETAMEPSEDLYRGLWYRGTVSILFGDNGIGKSVLAMQMALHVAKAHPGEVLLYLDMEMTRKQMKRRYHDALENRDAEFPPNFIYVGPQWDELDTLQGARSASKNMEGLFRISLQKVIDSDSRGQDVSFVVIDNLTSLLPDGEKGEVVTPFMLWLNQMKQARGMSFLMLAHTPKVLDCEPLHKNHLSGSKRISNAADLLVGMKRVWKSKDVYVKMLKNREAAVERDDDEVVRLRMARHGALLEFEEVGVVKESDCLPELVVTEARRAQDTSDRDRQVAEMLRQGMSERKISQALHISHSTVNAIKRRVVGRSDRPHDEKNAPAAAAAATQPAP